MDWSTKVLLLRGQAWGFSTAGVPSPAVPSFGLLRPNATSLPFQYRSHQPRPRDKEGFELALLADTSGRRQQPSSKRRDKLACRS